jgi:YgiT-type zinc finger domain-containing protein
MKEARPGSCALCGGEKKEGVTTFSADLGFGVVVIRNVPAIVCSQCGADWIADEVAGRIEDLVEEARRKRPQVEVMSLT